MNIDPSAVLAVISSQATQIAALQAENTQLRDALTKEHAKTPEASDS